MQDKQTKLIICIILNILLIPFKTLSHLFHLLLFLILLLLAVINYIGEKCIILLNKFNNRINKSETAIKQLGENN
jgi:hypothetical protein